MKLTRRDALLALSAGGLAVGAESVANRASDVEQPGLTTTELDTLVALAEILYPTQVDPSAAFVETFVVERFSDRRARLETAVESLRKVARRDTGRGFESLSPNRRESVLRATGADRAYPDPNGTRAQQLRYYLVNGLLFALYSTPHGAELVGSTNPRGYPGGQEAYQRRPER